MSFGERLKLLRNKKNVTQSELADKLGMSHSSVAMWETDSREPGSDMLVAMADYFNVTTDYILCRNESKTFNQTQNNDEEKTMNMENKELMIQNQLAFMDTLSRANGSGHKVDNEIKEVVRSLRVKTGITSFNKEVEKEASLIARINMRSFLDEFQSKDEYPLELILELKNQLYEKL